jgi:glycosyltransferase involved in cell wall biosynthesis
VRRNGIGIVHSYDAPGNVVAAPAAYGAARVITSQRAYRELAPRWMRPLLRMTDRLADRIVVNCRAIERHLVEQEGVRADKIRLCYNGIDVERFRPEGRERPAVLRDAALTVGVVCALRPEKDLGTLAEGFARAWREWPEMRLVVVGSGLEREPLERLLTELGVRAAAHLEPSTAEVAPWLRGIDIFVLPSKSEALSNALMEAMACGCVAVASAVGGNPELVKEGETGLLFPAGDAEALAGCLLQLARDPEQRRRMAAQAQRRMETEFTLPAAAKRMEEIYAAVLE